MVRITPLSSLVVGLDFQEFVKFAILDVLLRQEEFELGLIDELVGNSGSRL